MASSASSTRIGTASSRHREQRPPTCAYSPTPTDPRTPRHAHHATHMDMDMDMDMGMGMDMDMDMGVGVGVGTVHTCT